jgi:hypothetical protein
MIILGFYFQNTNDRDKKTTGTFLQAQFLRFALKRARAKLRTVL